MKKVLFAVLLTTLIFVVSFINISPEFYFFSPSRVEGQTEVALPQSVQENSDSGNWLWILPLLAVPFVILLFKRKNDEENDFDAELWPYDQYAVGIKGGKSNSVTKDENS